MRPLDTSLHAHELQTQLYRQMTDERRSGLALEMSDDVRRVAREGIHARHPEYSDQEVQRALIGLLYGAAAASKVWSDLPVPPP